MLRCLLRAVSEERTQILEINIPDLGVPHEAVVEPDRIPMCIEGAVCVILGEGIHVGGIGSIDGIPFRALLWCDSPAIVNA